MELSIGGTVIGPLPEARFRRGFARVHPGEVLLMLTDGILERRDKAGEFFGVDRVRGDRARAAVAAGPGHPRPALRGRVRLGRGPALGGRRDDRRREAGRDAPRLLDPTLRTALRASRPGAPRPGPRCSRPRSGPPGGSARRRPVRPRLARVEDHLRRERGELERLDERVAAVDGEAHRRALQERLDRGAVLPDVEAQQGDVRPAGEALVVGGELRQLLDAGLAPRGPEVDDDDLPARGRRGAGPGRRDP